MWHIFSSSVLSKGADLIGKCFYQDQFCSYGINSPILFQVKSSEVFSLWYSTYMVQHTGLRKVSSVLSIQQVSLSQFYYALLSQWGHWASFLCIILIYYFLWNVFRAYLEMTQISTVYKSVSFLLLFLITDTSWVL